MNLPLNKPSQGDGGNAAEVVVGEPVKASAAQSLTVGSIQFANAQLPPDLANEVMDQMADSIVELTQQLEEANARIALLEEEQRIMARKHTPRLTDEGDDYVQLTEKGRAWLEAKR